MFSTRRQGEPEYPTGIGAFECESAFDKVIQDAIQSDPVDGRETQCRFNLPVRQRCGRVAEQAQNTKTGRGYPRAGISQPFGDGIGFLVGFGRQSNYPGLD